MKLSFSTVMCMELSAAEVISLCEKYGFDGVEIRMEGEKILNADRGQAEEIASCFRGKNLSVPIVGTSVCLKKYEEDLVGEAFSCIDLAAKLGADGIRVFLGNFAARTDMTVTEPEHNGIVRALREICAYGEKKGVLVCVETHNEYATGKSLAALKKDVGAENLKFIWDIIHPVEDGETIAKTWESIGKDIVHVHIKDGFDRKDALWHDFCYTEIGKGSMPIRTVMRLLEQNKFQGFVSLEWERAWRPELRKEELDNERVLSDFVRYVRERTENLVPKIGGEKWKTFVPFKDNGILRIDSIGLGLEAEVENGKCSLHRWDTTAEVKEGEFYDFSVKYVAKRVELPQAAYVMLSVTDKDGTVLQREFADHVCEGHLCKKLKIHPTGCTVQIEFGLKCNGFVAWYEPELRRAEPAEPRKIRVASVCYDSYSKENEFNYSMAETIGRIGELIDKTAAETHPDLMVFAETLSTRATTETDEEKTYETEDGAYCTMMKEKARKYKCFIMFSYRELRDQKRYNTALLLDRNGETVGRYSKTHLTIGEYEMGLTPGKELPVFDTEIGKIGMLICYDGYFPEPARVLAVKGAEMILVSTAGDAAHRMVARAMENGVYVAVACVCNEHVPGIMPTKVISPKGEVLAETETDFTYAVADIDLQEKKYIYWLSVGACDGEPHDVYSHERRTDFYGVLAEEMN